MDSQMSRRGFCGSFLKFGIVAAVVPSALFTTGCGPALFLRAGVPRLGGVMWGAVRTRTLLSPIKRNVPANKVGDSALLATRLTARALIDGGDWYLPLEPTPSEMDKLEKGQARLVLYDERGDEFPTPYGIFEDVGTIQSCYRSEPRYLFEQPNFKSRRITKLNVGDEVGVFNVYEGDSTGWYHIQTTNKDKGWTHGNCLEPLPNSNYYR